MLAFPAGGLKPVLDFITNVIEMHQLRELFGLVLFFEFILFLRNHSNQYFIYSIVHIFLSSFLPFRHLCVFVGPR